MSENYGWPINQYHADQMAEDRAIETILKHEGGYQNKTTDAANKNSRGEWVGTNRGITPAVYEETYGKVPTGRDMQKITKQEAMDIYRKQYARPIQKNLGISPHDPMFGHILDIAVNHGYSGAVALVQRASGAKVDGKAGPGTQEAIAAMDPHALNEALVDARMAEYDRIIKSKPETAGFRNGWNKRAESFRNPQESKDGKSKPQPDPVAGEGIPR